MHSMSDRESFLRAIIAEPADDKPRLIFADWLDEHGESARAEFIRVQCQLALTERWLRVECDDCQSTGECGDCGGAGETAGGYFSEDGMTHCDTCRGHGLCKWCGGPKENPRHVALRHREQELYTTSADWLLPHLPDVFAGVVIDRAEFDAEHDAGHFDGDAIGWLIRGFVSHVTCTWADFSRNADAIRRATPLTDVRLTIAPVPYPGHSIRAGWFHPKVPPGPSTTASSLTEELFGLLKGGRPHGNPTRVRWYDSDADAMRDLRQAMDASGIHFELPNDGILTPTQREWITTDHTEDDLRAARQAGARMAADRERRQIERLLRR